jgi:hypothetical protein
MFPSSPQFSFLVVLVSKPSLNLVDVARNVGLQVCIPGQPARSVPRPCLYHANQLYRSPPDLRGVRSSLHQQVGPMTNNLELSLFKGSHPVLDPISKLTRPAGQSVLGCLELPARVVPRRSKSILMSHSTDNPRQAGSPARLIHCTSLDGHGLTGHPQRNHDGRQDPKTKCQPRLLGSSRSSPTPLHPHQDFDSACPRSSRALVPAM